MEKFNRGMNRTIRRKLIEAERLPSNIEQWYEHTTNLDKYWRESRRKEERLRERQKQGASLPRQQ